MLKIVILLAIILGITYVAVYPQLNRIITNNFGNTLKSIPLQIITAKGNFDFRVEIADNDMSRSRGLMEITNLDEQAGMLFIFDQPTKASFWMKNTYISLDLIFLDQDKKLINYFTNAKPLQETPFITPIKPCTYVIEINAGKAKQMELTNNSEFKFNSP